MRNAVINIAYVRDLCCTLIVICAFVSCISESKMIDKNEVMTANLDRLKVAEFKYSDIFKSATIIGFDENEAILGGINKMQVYKDHLFILDSQYSKAVYIYDKNGNLVQKVGNIGLAPEEYVSCDDFTINTDEDELYIFDSLQNRIYKYNVLSGKFKDFVSMDKNIHFNYINYNSGYLYGAETFFHPSQQNKQYFLLQQIDIKSGERKAQFMETSEYNKGWNDELIHGNVFYNIGKDEDLFFMGLMDTIMSIKKQTISPYLVIKSNDIVSTQDILENEKVITSNPRVRSQNVLSLINRLHKQGKIQHISNIFKYKNLLFFECMRKSSQLIRYDTKIGETIVYEKTVDDVLFAKQPNQFHIPSYLCSDSLGVYFCVTPECFPELKYFEKEKYISDKLTNKEYLGELNEESNPLILYYEFK